jgi:hypothetical protein
MSQAMREALSRSWEAARSCATSPSNTISRARNPNVYAWQRNRATAIHSKRSDNPHYANIFALGYRNGFWFDSSRRPPGRSGPTHKFRLTNVDLDSVVYGLLITGDDTTGQATNLTAGGFDPPAGGERGIDIESNGVLCQFSNVGLSLFQGNGVYVRGTSRAFIENVSVDTWDMSGRGFPAIEAHGNAYVTVGLGRAFDNGNGAPEIGGTGRVVVDR